MTITWRHMGLTLFIALALHGGIAFWLTLPVPKVTPEPPPPPVRINLLATVAETTHTPAVTPPPPVTQPPVAPKPKPIPKPKPKPAIKKTTPKSEPIVEPPPVLPKPQPIEPVPTRPDNVPLSSAATAKYEQLLVAWLEKHKEYPRRAKRLRIEGEGMLRILINRTGRVQQIDLEQSTGNRLLDKAVLDMAQRADPFPAMAEQDPRQELEFIVPVVFALR